MMVLVRPAESVAAEQIAHEMPFVGRFSRSAHREANPGRVTSRRSEQAVFQAMLQGRPAQIFLEDRTATLSSVLGGVR